MTKPPRVLISTIAALAALAITSSAAFAQAGMMRQGQGMGQGMMGPGTQQMPATPGQGMGYPQAPCPFAQGMGPGMTGPQMQQVPGMMGQAMGPGMMAPQMQQMPGMMGQGMGAGMMAPQMQQMPGMMGQGMGAGMMAPQMQQMPGMMGQGMGPGMMGPGGMQAMMAPGVAGRAMMGMRVTPVQNLTTDDVRYFFRHWLERAGNPRLKLGKVEQTDEDTIVAEIVTVDDSLVQRFEVDRHSGDVQPEMGAQEQQTSHH